MAPRVQEQIKKLEEGEIFFLYRARVESEEVRGSEDVQRFYMVLAAKWPKEVYRLFVVGRKKLPELTNEQHAVNRNWVLCILVSIAPDVIRRQLAAVEYTTETHGERFVPAAKSIGEGRYMLFEHDNHTEIAYALELPKTLGPAQEDFNLKREASFVVAIKNPNISTLGAPSAPRPPDYPQRLKNVFGHRRWIAVKEPAFLDYENARLLLLAAHTDGVEEVLGIKIDAEYNGLTVAAVCRELRLNCERERVMPLITGGFHAREESPQQANEVRRPGPEYGPN